MTIAINIVGHDNGVGLSRDMKLLADAFRRAGAAVEITAVQVRRGKLRKLWRFLKIAQIRMWLRRVRGEVLPHFDINLMIETIYPEYFPWATTNVYIPNPEWVSSRDLSALRHIDMVLAKTQHAQRIFAARGCRTHLVGFTSIDRNDPAVERERVFFHLAGASPTKGTDALYRLWRRHPEWPKLTIVCRRLPALSYSDTMAAAENIELREGYLSDEELRQLQNRCSFHLCPSETEGYGHYIGEALSVGAVVATLDAEPMNELVRPERGILVEPSRRGVKHLATTYFFDDAAMEAAIHRMSALNDAALEELSTNALAWFGQNREQFYANVAAWLAVQEKSRKPS